MCSFPAFHDHFPHLKHWEIIVAEYRKTRGVLEGENFPFQLCLPDLADLKSSSCDCLKLYLLSSWDRLNLLDVIHSLSCESSVSWPEYLMLFWQISRALESGLNFNFRVSQWYVSVPATLELALGTLQKCSNR